MRGRLAFVVPGGLRSATGGNLYDRAVIAELERRGWTVEVAEPGSPLRHHDVAVVDSLALRFGPPSVGGPVAALLHQLPSEAERRPQWREAEAATLASAELVVAVSEGLAGRVGPLTNARIITIPPGWDRSASPATGSVRDTVLCVANAHPGKGLPESASAFVRSGVDLDLVLVGDAERDATEGARLRAVLRRCRRPVRLTGVVSAEDLAALYARARVFLTASRYEGWPIAVAEAMANGIPVVGFQARGVAELVRTGRDGILVPTADLDALAVALARVAGDRMLARRLGSSARARARTGPTWEETARRFADQIEDLAGAPRATRRQATGAR